MHPGVKCFCLTALLAGTLSGQSWVMKLSGPGLGNPLTVNPLDSNVLYAAAGGDRIYVSRDRGYTWFNYGALVTGGGVVKSVSVSPADTLQMLAGIESSVGSPDRIMKTTDGGLNWTETWSGTFSYFGQPVEFSPSHDDTVYTMGLDTLYRSVDFGSTWDTVCTGKGFNAWCDAALRPDSAAVMYIGDNLSGIWKTTDHGSAWRKVYSTLGEIPSIAIDPFDPRVAYASKFGGGGGIVRTTNWGETWSNVTVPSGNRDTWWITCSPVHPGYVYYGTYTADTANLGIYFSRDAGASWSKINQGLTQGAFFNYGLLALDSLTLLALQSNGVYKYQYPTTIDVLQPDGGEYWLAESTYAITWSSTGLYALRLEYSLDDGATWTVIADSVPASATSWLWSTPGAYSESCLVRISDALFTSTAATSSARFTITDAYLSVVSPNGGEEWDAGSTHAVTWTSVSFDSLTIEYSTNNGASWSYVSEVPASAGAFPWTVPDHPTALALIRLRGSDDTNVVDQSDAVFTIVSVGAYSASMVVRDAGAGEDTLAFGGSPGATDGIDTAFGEVELAAIPPSGTFDVRWMIDGTNGVRRDIRDTLNGPLDRRTRQVSLQPGPGGYPLTLSWNPDSLRSGTYLLRDAAGGGSLVNVNMRRDSGVVISDPSVSHLELINCTGTPVTIPGTGGWLLISMPVDAGERSTRALFPFSPGGAYRYRNGYTRADTLRFGEGYWIKSEQVILTGCPVLSETTAVRPGWNMIGAPTGAVPTTAIVSQPESLVASPVYGYGPGGYYFADTLYGGEGYWVKCRDSGVLIVTTPPAQPPARAIVTPPHRIAFNELKVEDGGGVSTLYFAREAAPGAFAGGFEAPPAPPDLQRRMTYEGGKIGIFPEGGSNYPLVIEGGPGGGIREILFSWDVEIQGNFVYILIEKVGTLELSETPLTGRGQFRFSVSPDSKFSLSVRSGAGGDGGVPGEFLVGECYPNPFNPSTRVSLRLPSESTVALTVYNLLGEIVSTSAGRQYAAGDHQLEWSARRPDGSQLSSGVYFIRLTAVPADDRGGGRDQVFHAVRKVALLR